MPKFTILLRIFLIKSKENSSCPYCSAKLVARDSKNRQLIMDTGEKRTYKLRRLRCNGCGSLHTELPDIMIPYKHHASDIIEQVIDEQSNECPADDSTLYRWRRWWRKVKEDVEARLQAIYSRHHQIHIPLMHDFSLLESLKTNDPGWLADVHRILLLTGYQIHTQFAFCP